MMAHKVDRELSESQSEVEGQPVEGLKKKPEGKRHSLIGPVLFILAVLAILAAALAAMRETTGRAFEGENRGKALALIGAGETLKLGMDRVTLGSALRAADVDISIGAAPNQLFSPAGGGITPPSTGMANNPMADKWLYPRGTVVGLGLGANNAVLAVLPVSQGVCAQVNQKIAATAFVPEKADLGDFTAGVVSAAYGAWPAPIASSFTGCVHNASVSVRDAGPTSAYFFYQVLAVE